jgi:hypothetical protein
MNFAATSVNLDRVWKKSVSLKVRVIESIYIPSVFNGSEPKCWRRVHMCTRIQPNVAAVPIIN